MARRSHREHQQPVPSPHCSADRRIELRLSSQSAPAALPSPSTRRSCHFGCVRSSNSRYPPSSITTSVRSRSQRPLIRHLRNRLRLHIDHLSASPTSAPSGHPPWITRVPGPARNNSSPSLVCPQQREHPRGTQPTTTTSPVADSPQSPPASELHLALRILDPGSTIRASTSSPAHGRLRTLSRT